MGMPLEFSWISKAHDPVEHELISWEAISGLENRGRIEFKDVAEENSVDVSMSVDYKLPRILSIIFRFPKLNRNPFSVSKYDKRLGQQRESFQRRGWKERTNKWNGSKNYPGCPLGTPRNYSCVILLDRRTCGASGGRLKRSLKIASLCKAGQFLSRLMYSLAATRLRSEHGSGDRACCSLHGPTRTFSPRFRGSRQRGSQTVC